MHENTRLQGWGVDILLSWMRFEPSMVYINSLTDAVENNFPTRPLQDTTAQQIHCVACSKSVLSIQAQAPPKEHFLFN